MTQDGIRLRVVVIPKLHGSKQLKVQTWNLKYRHWETHGKLQVSGADWRQVLDVITDGARSQGLTCEVIDERQAAA